jgi:hypothetical protein
MNIDIIDEGTVVLFVPLDAAAREWLESNVHSEPWQWFGGALAVDRRYAGALADAIGGVL